MTPPRPLDNFQNGLLAFAFGLGGTWGLLSLIDWIVT